MRIICRYFWALSETNIKICHPFKKPGIKNSKNAGKWTHPFFWGLSQSNHFSEGYQDHRQRQTGRTVKSPFSDSEGHE